MSKTPLRRHRVADLIQREVATILRRDVSDPRLTNMNITEVDLSADLRNAKIYFTCLATDDLAAIKKSLAKACGFIRHQLAQRVELRYIPQLRFCHDDAALKAERIQKLINESDNEDRGK